MKLVFLLYCCVGLLVIADVNCNLYKGDDCTLHDGTKGYCELISKCNSAREMASQKKFPVPCGFEGKMPIVCCELSVAEQKCREYGKHVYVEEEVSSLLLDPVVNLRPECSQDHVPLIIDGVKVGVREFPHMAALGYGSSGAVEWKCGGSLISERFVMTAAHCIRGMKHVRLGDINVNDPADDKPYTQQVGVKRIVPHPDYKSSSYYNDIALVELDKNVTFSSAVRPACLHNGTELSSTLVATITGWGVTSYTNDEGSDELLKAGIRFQSTAACNSSYRSVGRKLARGILSESQICAGDPVGRKDTCVGDSGGPLQLTIEKPYCMYSLVGITSFGSIACGEFNTPAVYTRVSHYLPWITSTVWP